MPASPLVSQEPDRPDRLARSIWFGMRCDFTRAALEGAISSSEEAIPLAMVLPGSPRPQASGWPQPPFDRWVRSRGIDVIDITAAARPDWNLVLERLGALRPTIGVGACFPYKVPGRVREALPLGVINIHPSLLPVLRGPEPVFHAYRLGFEYTGVTLHLMDDAWDTGPVLAQEAMPIPGDIDARELETTLARRGGALLPGVIAAWQSGSLHSQPQDETGASWAPVPSLGDLIIPGNLSVRRVRRLVSATNGVFGPLRVRDDETGMLRLVEGLAGIAGDPDGETRMVGDLIDVPCRDGVVRVRVAPNG